MRQAAILSGFGQRRSHRCPRHCGRRPQRRVVSSAMRPRPRGAGPVEWPDAPIPDQGRAGRSGHSRRFAVRPLPRHYHVSSSIACGRPVVGNFFNNLVSRQEAATEPTSEAASEFDVTQIEPSAEALPGSASRAKPPACAAETRFKSCRWHEDQGRGPSYCSNRDVLPFAGKNGFSPEAWCSECTLFKVKRTTKKQPIDDYDGY